MTRAGWRWAPLAVIAAGGVGAFAIYTLGWHNSDAESDKKTEVAQAEAIGAVRLRAKRACEAPWWEGDDYCIGRVKATRFTAKAGGAGMWLVREHVRGDRPFQDICWVVDPERLPRRITEWPSAGLSPSPCECPRPSTGSGREPDPRLTKIFLDRQALEPRLTRIVSALCPAESPKLVP